MDPEPEGEVTVRTMLKASQPDGPPSALALRPTDSKFTQMFRAQRKLL